MSTKFFVVVIGAGPGTGKAAAVRFSKAYPVVLLTRSAESYREGVEEITKAGGKAIGITADAADAQSLDTAFETIRRELPDHKLAVAVYNVGGGLKLAPFLELKAEDWDASLANNARGLFIFAQKTIPLLLDSVADAAYPPTLLITGATASIRGSARWAAAAAGLNARRALGQSLAREFGPQGVHVAHAIVDGVIDIPRTKGYTTVNGGVKDGKISPDAIADTYWHLHTQHRSAFTQELDIRPFVEKF
ncbi:NAD(P)-binding protein [Thozetella sp. PMI_491]|nr:NAD(P)-binding protein [Thozetella sp. PMI_491]